ncbi:MAG: DUF4245 domain-containing protein [Acidothermales bacterium]|nr:DUF4245 domain-containing protein [Acidothermales bacterium]
MASTTEEEREPPQAGAASPGGRRRGRETVADMVRSLGVVLLIAGALVLLAPRADRDPVTVVDFRPQLAAARADAPYPVLGPEGLPADWRSTSVRLRGTGGVTTWHIGFVTPDQEYAAVEQSNDATAVFVRDVTREGRPAGNVDLAGQTWQRYDSGSGDERSLVRAAASGGSSEAASVVVTGTAEWAELEVLASSLRPG